MGIRAIERRCPSREVEAVDRALGEIEGIDGQQANEARRGLMALRGFLAGITEDDCGHELLDGETCCPECTTCACRAAGCECDAPIAHKDAPMCAGCLDGRHLRAGKLAPWELDDLADYARDLLGER